MGGGGGGDVVVGYKYYVGIHFVLCAGPIDSLQKIIVADRQAWGGLCTGTGSDNIIVLQKPELFGGEEREGGISGKVDVCMGYPTQTANGYLATQISGIIPAFRGVVSIILNQVYVGLNPYLKAWKFRAKRVHVTGNGQTQWYNDKAGIGSFDMNPVHIIYECLTDPNWGCGYTPSDIDVDNFRAAADQLFSEGFGLSFLWEKEQPIEDFIKEVLRHIDGAIYVNRTTGKFCLNLVRGNYVLADLPILDESIIMEVQDYTTPAFGEIVNSVTVNYWDISTGRVSSVTVQDIALIQSHQAVINSTIDYNGITSGDLATKVASRDLRSLSASAARCTIIANRGAAKLDVGDAFRMTWPQFGIADSVMRVVSVGLGDHTEGRVKITAVQDVFALNESVYMPPAPTEWTSPIKEPAPCPHQIAFEAPYLALVRAMGQATADSNLATDNYMGYFCMAGDRPSQDAIKATLWTNAGGGYGSDSSGIVHFCPSAVLSASAGYMDTTFQISSGVDLDQFALKTWAQIGSEIVRVDAVTSTSITVVRGCLDTVPATHSAGDSILFWEDSFGYDTTVYDSGEVISGKLLPVTGRGALSIDAATSASVTMRQRAYRPYPPGNFKVEGQYFPSAIQSETGSIALSWAHRSRTQQTGATPLGFTSGNIGPESGTTYNVRVYRLDTNAQVANHTDLTGTSDTIAMPTGTYSVRIELESQRSGLTSYYKHQCVFSYELFHGFMLDEAGDFFITEDGNNITLE